LTPGMASLVRHIDNISNDSNCHDVIWTYQRKWCTEDARVQVRDDHDDDHIDNEKCENMEELDWKD
jgi:hypothetical protein